MKLQATHAAVLEAADKNEQRSFDALADDTAEPPESVAGAAFDLAERGLVDVTERVKETVELTDEGERYQAAALPEVHLYRTASDIGATGEDAVPMSDVVGASDLGDAVDIALANYARKGYGAVDGGEVTADPDAAPETDAEAAALDAVAAGDAVDDDDVLEGLERRNLVVVDEHTLRFVELTDEGVTALMEGVEVAEAVGQLTPEMLSSGEWRDAEFADYDVEADADVEYGGKEHVLRQTAEHVKDVLVGMGFSEMDGPHADAEFWINDCLYMPQDHPARTHWDQFALDVPPMQDLPEDLMERVEHAHREGVGEDGDGYHSPWGEEMARSVDLRGHTTNLSMRYLSGEEIGKLEPPQRYFSVEKVYRNDTLDATHLLEFFQVEGWVMAENLSVRDLMGTFEEFYAQFGIENLRYKPHYNPYTEPSFELFVDHPETGETIELGNSGIFRREVLEPLGVDCDVMAWGISLERLLMIMTGAPDIRNLHGTLVDLDFLRGEEVVY